MIVLGMISQALLYLCFSLLVGSLILSLIPNNYLPSLRVPKFVLVLSIIGIIIFSFFPVLQILLYLIPNQGLSDTLQSVLLTFEVGKAWFFTFIVSVILLLYITVFDYRIKAFYGYVGIFLSFLLILALGWSSHPSSYEPLWGFIGDTIHFTAVTVWVGTLIVVSWFATNHNNWLNFLKWFTPVAIVCFGMTFVSGLLLMNIVVEDYTNSWLIPYGQSLLMKHLFIIPLIVFALINSIFIRGKVKKDTHFNPLPWVKTESVFLLIIFSATALLGQQSPPRNTNVSNESVSKLFSLFYQGQFQPNMTADLVINTTSMLLLAVAILFLGLMIVSFFKKMPAIMSFIMGVLLVFSLYLSLILSIQ
ncbi:copper resistance D family protein [Ureibacillus sp. 179-F W5.1 NHS]|mgnify:CR=1 FL=1|uniref:copper resistance D family protein n=1 Tax=unclassified Ureibacillus TaxID=2638520 RepID=UPI0031197313